ncbi:MAG TPA: FKBP-type peptidyl-prolyl cis-trans isomerase [Methylophaga aminisulfidivorans]|uniref:Peptidyl-prolyl cis-trans isomerase n=2 Tax=root TaxID=1 RepID=A0A7C2AA07_9GAMM|nr:FKBP-type peptidyl-prolyl cis-trans isomerase [Methylophaga aminisulfidivorans]HEC73213.1 FKBP-type peptidyl-prolyl cis-trans isomerase [Methylophaga aminisulfidivorans]
MKLKTLAILPLLFGANVMADDHAVTLNSDKEQISYIFGIQVGQNMKQEGVDLDLDAFKAGVADMLAGKQPQLDQATAEKVVKDFQAKKAQELAEVMNKKEAEAKAFMADNAKKDGVVTTDSGLQYEIIKEGDGATPTENDKVIAHYKGTLLDGTVFDSSYDRGEPATFPVNGVIQGWQEALKMMKEGGKWRIVVPANLAYGPRGAGQLIGPNETLVFEIELIGVTK